jgi:hypothetical protein
MRKFIADSLYNDCGLSTGDSKNTAARVLDTIKKFTILKG